MTEVKDYQVEAVARKICEGAEYGRTTCSFDIKKGYCYCGYFDRRKKQAETALEAAYAAKPEPEIPVTEEMIAAGDKANVELWGSCKTTEDRFRAIYRAMHKARPKESGGAATLDDISLKMRADVDAAACAAGVSDEAVKAYMNAALQANSGSWPEDIRAALTAALPHLTRHKAGTTPKNPIMYQRSCSYEIGSGGPTSFLSKNERKSQRRVKAYSDDHPPGSAPWNKRGDNGRKTITGERRKPQGT